MIPTDSNLKSTVLGAVLTTSIERSGKVAQNPSAGGRSTANNPPQRGSALRFLGESYQELKRVTWPTFDETLRLTLMVLLVSAMIGAFLFFVDLGFNRVMEVLLGT